MRPVRLCWPLFLLVIFFLNACVTTSDRSVNGLGLYFKVPIKGPTKVSALAEAFSVSAAQIRAINRLPAGKSVPAGRIVIVPVSTVALKSARIRKKYPIFSVEDSDKPIAFPYFERDGIAWPLDGIVTWTYGRRNGRPHQGIDIVTSEGTRIKSARKGKVSFAGWSNGYGWTVIVDHDGFKTLYAHCKDINVRKGQYVREGHLLGRVGRSGNADGYHLHFEYRTTVNAPLDPLPRLASYSAH